VYGPDYIRDALIAAPAILFSLTVHEFFHAYMAYRLGDHTARDMGRLTLNPLAHLDLFGTLTMFLSGFRFGWAKPVPINPYNVRGGRMGDLWISAAGPFSNLGLGFIFGLLYRASYSGVLPVPDVMSYFFQIGTTMNVSLAFFNLIPLFPLDGSHILADLLPDRYGPFLMQLDRIAPFLLIFLVFTGAVWIVLGPPIRIFVYLFTSA
jgi:Zn-dependent protease